MLPNNFRKILFFLFFLSCFYHAQNPSLLKLDSITDDYINEGKYEQAIDLNMNKLAGYRDTDDKDGIVTVYINVAKLLCSINKYQESLQYLDEAKKYVNDINDPILKGRLYFQYGRNYSFLELFGQSNSYYNKAIQYLEKSSDRKRSHHYLYLCYAWKWSDFDYTKQIDSSLNMQYKSLKLFPEEPLVYTSSAYRYMGNDSNLDSIKYYLDKAVVWAPKASKLHQGSVLVSLGDYNTMKNDYQKALQYYFQALTIFQKLNRKNDLKAVYQSIQQTYGMLNDREKEREYFKKYTDLSNHLIQIQKKASKSAVERLIREKENEENAKRNKLYVIITAIFILIAVLFYFVRKNYSNKQKKKDEIIDVKNELLEKKDKLIEKKSVETDKLKKKVNSSFDKLIQLAKASDPFFLTRFKELYPEFTEKLSALHPDLTELETKICAYIRLNLTNLEIGEYEKATQRAVETRKYRLKKKLGLSPDEDLNFWIQKL